MATRQIVCDGDSITRGQGADDPQSFPGYLQALLGSDWLITNKGVSGQRLDQMETDASTDIDALFNSGTYTKNIVNALGGTNDLYQGWDAATIITRLQTYWSHRKSAGWTVWVMTILSFNATLSSVDQATADSRIATVNTWIRANWNLYADRLVDIAVDPRLDDWSDTTYYTADGIHPTITGYAVLAELAAAPMRPVTWVRGT